MTPSPVKMEEAAEQGRAQDFQEPEGLNFSEILRILVHQRWKIFWTVLAFVALFLVYYHFCPRTYQALATVELPANSQATDAAIRQLASLPSTGDPIQTYIDVAQSNSIAVSVIRKLDLVDEPQFSSFSILKWQRHKPTEQNLAKKLIKSVVSIDNSKSSDILGVQVNVVKNPKLASDIANAWAQAFIDLNLGISQESARRQYGFIHNQLALMQNKLEQDRTVMKNYLNPSNEAMSDEIIYDLLLQQDQQTQIQANEDTSGIVVVDTAQVPESPIWPSLPICVILGLFLGLGVGVQGVLLIDKFQDRIKAEEDLKRGNNLILLAQIPDFRRENGKLVFPATENFSRKHLIGDPRFEYSSYRESFKVFRTNFTFATVDGEVRALAVLSANPGEGKSVVNSNLALTLAETGKKVLLVDADLRKPSIGIVFGVATPKGAGLPLLLAGEGRLEDMLVDSGFPNLTLLPNGTIPPNPAELLASGALKKVIIDLKARFDYIVFDGAPVLPVTDSVVMATQLDGVMLLGRWNKTRRSEFQRAYRQLRSVGALVLGNVLNAIEVHKGMYGYYGYGYGYGFGYDKKSKDAQKSGKGPKDA
jgi:capsular exopolysaccharide synthesis family protein